MGVADVWSIGELLRNKPRHGLPRNDTPIIQTLDTVILKYRGVTVAGGASVGGRAGGRDIVWRVVWVLGVWWGDAFFKIPEILNIYTHFAFLDIPSMSNFYEVFIG
jgi:hypothetical protein